MSAALFVKHGYELVSIRKLRLQRRLPIWGEQVKIKSLNAEDAEVTQGTQGKAFNAERLLREDSGVCSPLRPLRYLGVLCVQALDLDLLSPNRTPPLQGEFQDALELACVRRSPQRRQIPEVQRRVAAPGSPRLRHSVRAGGSHATQRLS